MQKILRRTAMAERKAARVKAAAEKKEARTVRRERNQAQWGAIARFETLKHIARKERRENWEMGPIAPNRHAVPGYGAISDKMLMDSVPLLPHEIEARTAWAGGRNTLCLAQGDRVVVVEGRWQGKIGTVEEINMDRAEVSLGGLTKAAVLFPEQFLAYAKTFAVAGNNMKIPISWIRLVHPLPDPETGLVKDTIIQQLVATSVVRDRPTRTSSWSRVVPRLNVAIPWPKKPEDAEKNKEPHKCDTVRIDAEKATFVPTLMTPPMPSPVINELRNQYSRFRTRHDPEWISRKESVDQREKSYLTDAKGTMLTPLHEMHIIRKLERQAAGQPKLSADMLENIGRIIAKNQPKKLADMQGRLASAEVQKGASSSSSIP